MSDLLTPVSRRDSGYTCSAIDPIRQLPRRVLADSKGNGIRQHFSGVMDAVR